MANIIYTEGGAWYAPGGMCCESGVWYTRDPKEAGAGYVKVEYTATFTSPGAGPTEFSRVPVYVLGGQREVDNLMAYWQRTAWSGGVLSGWTYTVKSVEPVAEVRS